jgi:sugar/nucleoside kinase (ribokinase family)
MKRFQVTGVGNALVDVLAHCDDAFLRRAGVERGIMTLIDGPRATELYAMMPPAREISGGSAANTLAGLGMLGRRAAYVGKVREDQLGAIFAHDIRSLGVAFDVAPPPPDGSGQETGRCLVLVTPDGERSMSTYLGASAELSPADIDEGVMADSEWLFLEGYRFDGADSHAAFARAIRAAKGGGGRVALTLSDPFCVERHHAAFRRMVREDVDLLFANAAELRALYRTDALDDALEHARGEVATTACTMSEDGVRVATAQEQVEVPAERVELVDATGAGDLFAAGFLHGLLDGRDPAGCGRLGCLAAAEVISHLGARPEADLRALLGRAE